MDYTFLRPAQQADFESRLAELSMKVDRDFGSFENGWKTAFQLFEKAQENMTPEEVPQFLKLIGHFKLLADLAKAQQEEYYDLEAEISSYISGNYIEHDFELIYLDHKDFTRKYPNFNETLPK